ncbi:MAG: S24 family peptidase [Pseudomonadota bacterium]
MEGLEQDAALIRDLVRYAGTSAAAVATKARVDPKTIQLRLNGKAETRLSQRTIEKLSDAFPHFPGWGRHVLAENRAEYRHATEQSRLNQEFADRVLDTGLDDDSLFIELLELGYGMGGTFLDDPSDRGSIERFPSAFVRMFTNAPANQLVFARGIGDSMEPTIGDRDLLLIDRSLNSVRLNDQIWVLASGGIGMVKRVRVKGEEEVWLLSDSDRVSDYTVAQDEITVIGRVVAIVKRV